MRTACLFGMVALFALGQSYQEPYRPQFHFSPKQFWTNDPNGLVFFEGEYHLFFQYNPFGDQWGHMSWGHAVSADLIHWKELPVALREESGVMIFTGSIAIDRTNTSGFCLDQKPCMIAVYTGAATEVKPALQTQNIAYSNDRGRTWTKYSKNPVLNLHLTDFRDPDVFWSEQSKRWIMTVSLPTEHKAVFYGSADFKSWDKLSEFGPAGTTSGQWECPVLMKIPVDGNPANALWVLKVGLNPGSLQGGSGEQYFVGSFDGTRFLNSNPSTLTLWSDYGKDCYCGLAFHNLPSSQSPLMLGWMSNWQYADKLPTHPWRGQMTFPRELGLRTFPEGIRMVQKPVASLAGLRGKPARSSGTVIPLTSQTFEVEASVDLRNAQRAGWKIVSRSGAYTTIGYDRLLGEVFVDRSQSGDVGFHKDFPARTAAPLSVSGPVSFDILVDRNSVEVFVDEGRVVLTNLVFAPDASRLVFFSEGGGTAKPPATTVWPIRSFQ